MIRQLITAAALAAPIAIASASPAEAAYNIGVKKIDIDSDPALCLEAGALPPGFGGAETCDGIMPSNTIYVQQGTVGSDFQFRDLIGTGATADDVWIRTEYEAQCRSDYRLYQSFVSDGSSHYSGGMLPKEVGKWFQYYDVNTSNKTIPRHQKDVDAPVDTVEHQVFNSGAWQPGYGTSFAERGEILIQEAVDAGELEWEARLETRTEVVEFDLHGGVICRGVAWPNFKKEKHDGMTVPIEVVYLGINDEPGNGWRETELPEEPEGGIEGGADQISVGAAVTDVSLSASLDEEDPCKLNLRAVFYANQPMTIDYRFVDEMGISSVQQWTAHVDETLMAVQDHYAMLPVVESTGGEGGGDGGWLVNPEAEGGELDLVQEESDNEQGYYRVEFFTPHHGWSEIASYNVPPCTTPAPDRFVPNRGSTPVVEIDPVQTWIIDFDQEIETIQNFEATRDPGTTRGSETTQEMVFPG